MKYIVEDQMLHIHFKYHDQRIYDLVEGPTFAAANLPGWERQLDVAESAEKRRSQSIKKDKRLNQDFENGFFFFFFFFF